MLLAGAKQVTLPNKENQFKKGKSGNAAGRPKGSLSVDTIVRRILEGEEKLPQVIADTIKSAVGTDLRPRSNGDGGPSPDAAGPMRNEPIVTRARVKEGVRQDGHRRG
jgi:hypothetical protein